jgi:Tfp pilus assembly protein PilN
MRANTFNLARRPFANQAPVLRIGGLLALLAVLLLIMNVQRYRNYFAGQGEQARSQISEIDRRIESLDRQLVEQQRELAQYDVEALNQQVEFLNLRIRERTFGWSRLFQDLEAVTPADVRLERVSPRQAENDGVDAEVLLTLSGVAKSEEGVLDFIDALFAHKRFINPDPASRAERDNQHDFSLSVTYLPPRRGRGADRADADSEGAGS